jgi:CBS domain-containing protein
VTEADTPLALFRIRVRDLLRRPPVSCAPETPAAEVARRLSREAVGSVVVTDADGRGIGIVTDRDLRDLVASGGSPDSTPAAALMSSPLVGIRPAAFAFEALLEMTRRGIRHLAVVDDGRLAGVVSSRDLLAAQTDHPLLLARDITRATSVAGLAELAQGVTRLVRRLVREGATAYDIGQIVAELNDRMVVRVLGLATADLEAQGGGEPPVPWCWLAFGSEARREQTLRTDQDNGLVYAAPSSDQTGAAAAYFARLAAAASDALVAVGFPPCPGGAMASNPRWCQPLPVWADYFRRWIAESQPEQLLSAGIYFDLRPLVGATELAASLVGLVREEAPRRPVFLALLAREVVEQPVPLTLLRGVAVRRRGARAGTVDLKSGGMLQLVGAGRLSALELELAETNTVERFQAAAARGVYKTEEAREVTNAYQHLMRLRLVHQLERLDAGEPPDNDVDPSRLSRADGLLLREALRTVTRVQAELRERYRTHLLT